MSHDPEDWCKIWRKTDLLFQKRIWWILTRAISKVSKICTFIGSYCVKYLMFDLQKYRGVILLDTEEWYKIWRKIDLWFEKWHEKFGKFSPAHLKVFKLGLWWDPFIQSRRCIMRLKLTEELCVMTMKNDTKFEKELTRHLKINIRNLRNFDSNTQKSKNLAL